MIFGKDTVSYQQLQYIKENVSRNTFIRWLTKNYSAIRCYHAGRPYNIDSYFQHGFRPINIKKALLDFETLLERVNFQRRKDLSETIEIFQGKSDRYINFILDKDDYFDTAPHYWIYGSEFMLCLAQNTSYHLKNYLKEIGIPTIFTCDIPFSKINEDELLNLYDRIKEPALINCNIFSNYTIIIESQVEAEFITSHEHPNETVYDYHNQNYYTNRQTSCPRCMKGV